MAILNFCIVDTGCRTIIVVYLTMINEICLQLTHGLEIRNSRFILSITKYDKI